MMVASVVLDPRRLHQLLILLKMLLLLLVKHDVKLLGDGGRVVLGDGGDVLLLVLFVGRYIFVAG